ncbi:hypothetical protein ELH67_08180 [Rhizobium ruizarguesonis]|uniref:hypothetical protein n=1 Tax=Rhizobium ruizarguesonis TaxID=2081791 RepID=UPI00102F6507|nr:hypothetical protein [Rhizobium ruizarguesonis]TAZ94535.1 hypothetical protein ELH67_08180 [Rhizobium ruizarguesonis]TBA37432.1 hypothetical protein ELH60_08215 [Rhizobium ruizarguesonis]TBC62776.1 hypothetical protein ELH36_08205 [Rhizobium ruizarguesonis]
MSLTEKANFTIMAALERGSPLHKNESMRLLINVFVATVMLLGSLAAPCIAAPVDHGQADRIVVRLPATSEGHHRGDGRSVSGTHCQQDGIVAQVPVSLYAQADAVAFDPIAPIPFVGAFDPVEQRPPIAMV